MDSSSRWQWLVLCSVLAMGLLATFINVRQPQTCRSNQDTCGERKEEASKDSRHKNQQTQNAHIATSKELEVSTGKASGDICLTPQESWKYMGSNAERCVVFTPGYIYMTDYGRLFVNERKEYKQGFTAYFARNHMVSWEYAQTNYINQGQITVSGAIESYEGRPQITINNTAQITKPTLLHCDTSYGCVYSR